MKIEQKTEVVTVEQPVPGKGVVIFDNLDIVRLVRIEAQRILGVPNDKINALAGGVTSAKTGKLLPGQDLIRVEVY